MYLKKLEIVGFKSFFNKTVLHFEPGISAIVGPNGCGKSNIFDAIRWVLGEQSIKSLRGSESQDVIFNGTDTKEPLSMAEVTLAFDNSKRFFNVDHDEVAISRRIYRSGESEYLLNKTVVRLKDVLDIFLGTGIGAESYSLVQQGKIDLILSSRPEDRRLVFDEASGITKYKSQKREATRKLDETEQNLLRVNDIITEVKRQIGSLERQANKARRYKEVFEELKNKEISYAVIQKNQILSQKDTLISNLRELEALEAGLLESVHEQEAKISNRQEELKGFEESLMKIRSQIMELNNTLLRNSEHINFNRERIRELESAKENIAAQITQTRERLGRDEEKLKSVKDEYNSIHQAVESKSLILKAKETELGNLNSSTKLSLEKIADAKKLIMELAANVAAKKNQLQDFTSREQVFLARKRRLELEKAKINEEKSASDTGLAAINQEVLACQNEFDGLKAAAQKLKDDCNSLTANLNQIGSELEGLEKKSLSLESQKEFLEKLRTKYEDISESMNACVFVDKLPADKMSGMVIKINNYLEMTEQERAAFGQSHKLGGEAKPMDLDTSHINEKLAQIHTSIETLRILKTQKESQMQELSLSVVAGQEQLRSVEMNLVNKKANQQAIEEQNNKLREEVGLIEMELSETLNEISALEAKLALARDELAKTEQDQKDREDSIKNEENNIASFSSLKEMAIVLITQIKTELASLEKKLVSDESTLKILEDSYSQDKESFNRLQGQLADTAQKQDALALMITELESKTEESKVVLDSQNTALKKAEEEYDKSINASGGLFKKLDDSRAELDSIKNRLYELQMQNKDIDFKYLGIKERMSAAYKIDLDNFENIPTETQDLQIEQQIQALKDRLDSYGTVNLVAIEEYDELKKRYDFLVQQQTDLNTAKETLHEAILKINRTTKKMFIETFELIKVEFKNFFRLLFNGGDAQLFLLDENDPLESGIEIICRPPGKKLQNVLLLSGGEKTMSAIALIFAIFKVKPSPFCVLDEIDAALDEANVDRFGRMLHDFASNSQFIVITHNKKTIANADVMYGITMEESGVSKIVSVKFHQEKPAVKDIETDRDKALDPA